MPPEYTPTGWIFILRHESDEEVQKFLRDYRSKLQDATLKRKTSQQKQLMSQHEDDLRIAHVIGWKWKDGEDAENGRPPFTRGELKRLLSKEKFGYHLRNFIDNEVGSLEDFLERSGNS